MNCNGSINMILIILIIIILFNMCNIKPKTTEHFYYKGKHNVPSGGECNHDRDCANNSVCAHESVGGPTVCCPSGSNSYDASDARWYCNGQNVGQSCAIDANCVNSACGRESAGGNKVCCPSNNTERYGGYDYCTEMPNGNACFSNAMCASGACIGPWGKEGVCDNAKNKESCDNMFKTQVLNGACGTFLKNAASSSTTAGVIANSLDGIGCTEIMNANLSTCYQTGKWPGVEKN